ncbi:hypothetical protein F01_480141 [Burkholderia cenocepacia]|nr:hypothetical protein F01_480141 [Burkholderia cenocepacia]
MRMQAPNDAHDFFILGKNSDDQAVGNTRENVGKYANSMPPPGEAAERAGRRRFIIDVDGLISGLDAGARQTSDVRQRCDGLVRQYAGHSSPTRPAMHVRLRRS